MKPLIIANWKMNPTSMPAALALARAVARKLKTSRRAEVVIAPPYPYLAAVGRAAQGLKLAAQDVFWERAGPYTGEISPAMLKDLGVAYVIIGHSERRRLFGEGDAMVNRKVRACLRANLQPVVAVGETDYESREVVPRTIADQLSQALAGIPRRLWAELVIAYEPVWAISTSPGSRADTPDNATRRALYIRKVLTKLAGRRTADSVRIIYGGSVNAKNAASFISSDIRGMEGVLVGGASLNAGEFIEIVENVASKASRSR